MSTFRQRLARLSRPPPPAVAVGEASAAAAAPAGPNDPDWQARRADLQRLRGDIDRLLRSLAGPAVAPQVCRAEGPSTRLAHHDLPRLEVEETPAGRIHVRRFGLERSHRVGHTALEGMCTASSGQLALLARTPEVADLDPRGALLLDTETTGLGGAGTYAFLVGLGWFDGAGFVVEQCFLPDPSGEAAMLERVRARLSACAFVVSYNGKSFDVPLLRDRYAMCRLEPPPERPHVDLLHVVRRLHAGSSWPKSLTSAERHVLRFDRGPDVSGWEVAERYLRFLRGADAGLLGPVIRHNEHDVVSLAGLLASYGAPLAGLPPMCVARAARVMKAEGALAEAWSAAQLAVDRGGGPVALRIRAEVAKALGDRAGAALDLEALVAAGRDDDDVRLELAKLYEHHLRVPQRALELIARGTGELPGDAVRRRARLLRKLASSRAPPAVGAGSARIPGAGGVR